MSAHEIGAKHYAISWVALLVLAGVSYGLSFVELGAFAAPVAVAIALVKATIVGLFFMHLAKEATSSRLTVLTAGVLVVILLAFTMTDVITREDVAVGPPIADTGRP